MTGNRIRDVRAFFFTEAAPIITIRLRPLDRRPHRNADG